MYEVPLGGGTISPRYLTYEIGCMSYATASQPPPETYLPGRGHRLTQPHTPTRCPLSPEGTAGSGVLAHTMACSSLAETDTSQYCSVDLRSAVPKRVER